MMNKIYPFSSGLYAMGQAKQPQFGYIQYIPPNPNRKIEKTGADDLKQLPRISINADVIISAIWRVRKSFFKEDVFPDSPPPRGFYVLCSEREVPKLVDILNRITPENEKTTLAELFKMIRTFTSTKIEESTENNNNIITKS